MILIGKTQAQLDAEKIQAGLKAEQDVLQSYLDSTDWYVTRYVERQIAIPDEIKVKRLEAIDRINIIKEQ